VVKVNAPRMLLAQGFLRAVFEIFERHRTSVDVVATSEISVSATLDDAARLDELVVDLRRLGDVAVERDRGIVAIVGSGIGDRGDCMGRALVALGEIRIHMLSLSATGINLTAVVDAAAVPEAMRRLHEAMFTESTT
jgi:aspartate kinase